MLPETAKFFYFGRFLFVFCSVSATVAICAKEEEPLKNLTLVTWAHAVNDKKYLEASLASEFIMFELPRLPKFVPFLTNIIK